MTWHEKLESHRCPSVISLSHCGCWGADGKVREVASDDEAEQDPLRDSVSGHQADLDALRCPDTSIVQVVGALHMWNHEHCRGSSHCANLAHFIR